MNEFLDFSGGINITFDKTNSQESLVNSQSGDAKKNPGDLLAQFLIGNSKIESQN